MRIKFIVGTDNENDYISPLRLDLLADEVTAKNLERFSGIVSEVLHMDPMYSFPSERRTPLGGFKVKDGKLIKTVRADVLKVEFYKKGGESDFPDAYFNPELYFATRKGLQFLECYAFIALGDLDMAEREKIKPFVRPNFLAFRCPPSEGKRVLEEIASEFVVRPRMIHPYSSRDTYEAAGLTNPQLVEAERV